MTNERFPTVIGFAGYSGSGKTTLLEKLIPDLKQKLPDIGLIKHTHHEFEIDHPGKDSYRLRKAGTTEMLIGSTKRWALIHENNEKEAVTEINLDSLIQRMDTDKLDIILFEGFKDCGYPLIWVQRETHTDTLDFSALPVNTVALAWKGQLPENPPVTRKILDLDNVEAILSFILEQHRIQQNRNKA